MGKGFGITLAFAFALVGSRAAASAWPVPPGETWAILKFEGADAGQSFDRKGVQVPITHLRDDDVALFVEHGLTPRLTFQGQVAYTFGEDATIRYSGMGPTQFGLRYVAFQQGRTVVSVYAGAIAPGVGRNADYALPDQGDWAGEVRVLVGQSFDVAGRNLFFSVEAARLFRSKLADETHLDLTAGIEHGRWLYLLQSYSGEADQPGVDPNWTKIETTLVRRLGAWRVQGGWRQTLAGRFTPVSGGPVVALWRRF